MAVEQSTPVTVRRRLFTADEYQRMGEAGILSDDERVELIDGQVLEMTPIGPRHLASVDRATREFVTVVGDQAIVRVQGSVRLNLHNQPQPDLLLLRPRADFYASRHAGPADVLLVIEVAQSSINYDRRVKSRLYARLGILEYWLADQNKNVVTCYTEPRDGAYQGVREHHRGELLAPQLLPECPIAVDVLLIE